MSKQQKLITRLKSRPKDFTWDELCSLMRTLGYELVNANGSRRRFFNPTSKGVLTIHEPHPRNYLLDYQIKDVLEHLNDRGAI